MHLASDPCKEWLSSLQVSLPFVFSCGVCDVSVCAGCWRVLLDAYVSEQDDVHNGFCHFLAFERCVWKRVVFIPLATPTRPFPCVRSFFSWLELERSRFSRPERGSSSNPLPVDRNDHLGGLERGYM